MITLWDSRDFGSVLTLDWYRWYVGVSYESLPDIRVVVIRIGPLVVHLISR